MGLIRARVTLPVSLLTAKTALFIPTFNFSFGFLGVPAVTNFFKNAFAFPTIQPITLSMAVLTFF
ncbi:MAG: hypothetical protein HKN31_06560 [Pricia sp.]|nr:hypothetical protein [Pricia sp.]